MFDRDSKHFKNDPSFLPAAVCTALDCPCPEPSALAFFEFDCSEDDLAELLSVSFVLFAFLQF